MPRRIFGVVKRFVTFGSARSFHPDLASKGGIEDEFFAPLYLHLKGSAKGLTMEDGYRRARDQTEV